MTSNHLPANQPVLTANKKSDAETNWLPHPTSYLFDTSQIIPASDLYSRGVYCVADGLALAHWFAADFYPQHFSADYLQVDYLPEL